jgi:sugar phosphate isomerase/epimerase
MRIGVCASADALPKLINAGADYIECRVTELTGQTDAELAAFKAGLDAAGMACEACAVLFPGADIPLTGERADDSATAAYLPETFKRLRRYVTPDVIVFGSGGARRRPDGFDAERAFSQLISAGRLAADAAGEYGMTIALEPLNRSETNMINTLAEAAELVKAVDRSNFKIVADIYHMLIEDDPPEAIIKSGGLITHVHIASKEGRLFPQEKDRDRLAPYFYALKRIGYNGRISIEAGGDYDSALPASVKFLTDMCL